MEINNNILWQAFALTGDPLAYLEYRNNRQGFKGISNESRKSKRVEA